MRAACSGSGAGFRARNVALGVAFGSQAARPAVRVSCNVARVSGVSGDAGGTPRTQYPTPAHIFAKESVGIVKALVKSNEFGVLWRYLVTEAREARLDKRMELAQLEDDLEDKEDRLQEATILYSSIVGPVDQLRFLERIQDDASVMWDRTNPVASWGDYIAKRPALQECLLKRNINVKDAGAILSSISSTQSDLYSDKLQLLKAVFPDEQQMLGSTLLIGPPLSWDECKVMACLCDDAQVPYELMEWCFIE